MSDDLGTRLCTACGICCTGSLHDQAKIRADEVPACQALGMTIVRRDTDSFTGFKLPCPRLEGSICSVYEVRPSPCHSYRCQLLRDVQAGERTLVDALPRVATARRLLTEVYEVLPQGDTIPDARERLTSQPLASPAEAQLRLRAAALSIYLDRFFRHHGEGKIMVALPDDHSREPRIKQ